MYEEELKQYCRDAKQYLYCDKAHRQEFERYIRDSARDYLANEPNASFEELRCLLGVPEEAAKLYMETLPIGTATRFKRVRRRIRCLINAVITAVILALCWAVFALLYNQGFFDDYDPDLQNAKSTHSFLSVYRIRTLNAAREHERAVEEAAREAEARMQAEKAAAGEVQEAEPETDMSV